MMKPISNGISSFEEMIKEGALYIDKTGYLYNLIGPVSGFYFLSRPRRFGKTLTLSTLEAIFQGKKELFDGLAISKTDYEFKKYPVIHIDFSALEVRNASFLEETLVGKFTEIAYKYETSLTQKIRLKPAFEELIRKLNEKFGKVVVLIDEYDKPLSDNIDNIENVKQIRDVLRGFYEVLKACSGKIRFLLITGVTKYSKMSIFSSMNNLTDISFNKNYSTLLGYTQEELEKNFSEYIEKGIKTTGKTRDVYLKELKTQYDGYCFVSKTETVYNPVSIGQFFYKGGEKFEAFWVDTGGQKLLYETAKKIQFDIENDILEHFSLIRLLSQDIVEIVAGKITKEKYNSLLLQTGYLTIANSNEAGTVADLGFPNQEVKTAFSEIVMPLYTNDESIIDKESLLDYLEQGDFDSFVAELKSDFARIPYYLIDDYEKSFHQAFYCMMLSLGAKIEVEVPTNKGRIDAVVETNKHIYIFEFKRNQSATKAIAQIREKGYAERYLAQNGKQLHLVGVSFSSRKRTLGSIKIENI